MPQAVTVMLWFAVGPAATVGGGVVFMIPTSGHCTVMWIGPEDLLPGLVSTSAVSGAVLCGPVGSSAAVVVELTVTDLLVPAGMVPNEQLKMFPPVIVQLAASVQIGRASCRKECRSRWSPYH